MVATRSGIEKSRTRTTPVMKPPTCAEYATPPPPPTSPKLITLKAS